ncbi:T9SS type A sorting domain-containing protein [Flavobacterium salilacus subsp. salilacus]|uniref:T9SS type A sorting domain-containing protein n=1 Tax=Flavobacterium TaxID=237 RepID=UPI00107556B5|nr:MULTISPECIES: T9SS type A sorting domain-containing protein [Flavobacterium]KAF2518129.1 T9SS type A sorting domain-containing protein [Flavobacterium salilacus subsp. salilacus]MBE1615561.1 T9SS type A sorting domain-containing protein [Flavobacterium sp. SaA2.13]
MKKIYSILPLLFAAVITHAQDNINFETGGAGLDYTWNIFENDTNPALEYVANPNMSGINTSPTVAKYTVLETGMPWAGCETSHDVGMADFVLTADNATVKIMVYKSVISDVGLKLVTPTGAALPEIKIPNTVINQWEELTFDFSSQIGFFAEPFDQVVVFPDFSGNPRTYGTIAYFDNITFGIAEVMDDEPMVAAPDPTLPQEQVISMFSGVYTNVPVDTWLTPWSAASLQEVQIQGNDTKKYVNVNFAGIETIAQMIDATDMTHFNFNAWSADFTQLRVKLVDFGADAAFGGGDDTEHEITYATPAQGEWLTYNIPLSDFTGLVNRDHIAQLIISSNGTSTIYIDNVYFSNGDVVVIDEPMVAAPDPTLPQEQVISMFSGVYTNVPVDTWLTSWSQAALEEVQIQGNDTKKYTNLNFAGIETIAQMIDATDMTHFNFNAWSSDFTELRIKLVDFGADAAFGGGDDTEHEITYAAPAQGEWLTYNIPLSDFTGLVNRDHMAQLIISSNGTSTVFIDNVYFSDESVVVIDEPMVAAPDPTVPEAQVISMFSGVYTDVTVDTWLTEWSSGGLEDIQIQGNDTKKYTNLNFIGIETIAEQIDATNMEFFNVNVWSADFTQLRIKLVDFGADAAFGGGDDTEHEITYEAPAQGEWLSYSIPLSDFTGLVNTDRISQLIFSSNGTSTVYIDNVFFHTTSTASAATFAFNNFTMYPNPATQAVNLSSAGTIETVTIHNLLGQEVMKVTPNANTTTVNVAQLQNGIYVINAVIEGKVATQKFIKN